MIKRWIPFWVVPVLILMAIGTVWLRLSIVRTTYEISQTEKMIANLLDEKERANLKVTELRSPKRLETLARAKFKLDQPRSDQVVHLK